MSTPAAILAVMRASRPRCRDSGDVLAYALHAATMAEGYRLLAAGPAAETPESARTDPNADPSEGWTAWEGAYAFRYARERTVDAASPSSSNRPSGAEAPSAPPHHEILVKSMVVGDAMLVSALVSRVGDASPSESPPVRTAEFSLAAHVEPAAAAADAAASLRRVDEPRRSGREGDLQTTPRRRRGRRRGRGRVPGDVRARGREGCRPRG